MLLTLTGNCFRELYRNRFSGAFQDNAVIKDTTYELRYLLKKSTRLANVVKQPKSGSIGFRFEKSSIVSLICFISNYINNYLPKLCTSSSCRRIVKTLVNFLGIGY